MGRVARRGHIFEGLPAIRSFLETWIGEYQEYHYEQEVGLNLGNGVVFVVDRPTGSTGSVQERWAFTSAWAAGVIVRVIVDNDIDKARAAAEQLVQERSGAGSS